MDNFKQYRCIKLAELRPYVAGENVKNISISKPDIEAGSPKLGDMIARNPRNHNNQWLIAKKYFQENFAPV